MTSHDLWCILSDLSVDHDLIRSGPVGIVQQGEELVQSEGLLGIFIFFVTCTAPKKASVKLGWNCWHKKLQKIMFNEIFTKVPSHCDCTVWVWSSVSVSDGRFLAQKIPWFPMIFCKMEWCSSFATSLGLRIKVTINLNLVASLVEGSCLRNDHEIPYWFSSYDQISYCVLLSLLGAISERR